MTSYRLVSRDHQGRDTTVTIGSTTVGSGKVLCIAGPCAVESLESTMETARGLHRLGVRVMRAGAFKPRTSPYSFRGLGEEGLRILDRVRAELGLSYVTEVLEPDHVDLVAEHADALQVGTRNMQNFALLERLGNVTKPVILKRGMAATVEEFLCAAEYIVAAGNRNVILCERGVRGFDPATRAMLDITSVALLKQLTHLPVIVDPSHATGRRDLVCAVALGGIAAGADGILVEAHHDPATSIVDAAQTIDLAQLSQLLDAAGAVAGADGRTVDRRRAVPVPSSTSAA